MKTKLFVNNNSEFANVKSLFYNKKSFPNLEKVAVRDYREQMRAHSEPTMRWEDKFSFSPEIKDDKKRIIVIDHTSDVDVREFHVNYIKERIASQTDEEFQFFTVDQMRELKNYRTNAMLRSLLNHKYVAAVAIFAKDYNSYSTEGYYGSSEGIANIWRDKGIRKIDMLLTGGGWSKNGTGTKLSPREIITERELFPEEYGRIKNISNLRRFAEIWTDSLGFTTFEYAIPRREYEFNLDDMYFSHNPHNNDGPCEETKLFVEYFNCISAMNHALQRNEIEDGTHVVCQYKKSKDAHPEYRHFIIKDGTSQFVEYNVHPQKFNGRIYILDTPKKEKEVQSFVESHKREDNITELDWLYKSSIADEEMPEKEDDVDTSIISSPSKYLASRRNVLSEKKCAEIYNQYITYKHFVDNSNGEFTMNDFLDEDYRICPVCGQPHRVSISGENECDYCGHIFTDEELGIIQGEWIHNEAYLESDTFINSTRYEYESEYEEIMNANIYF